MPEAADLPNDVEALKGIILEHTAKLEAAEARLIFQKLELEKLRFEIACLKRIKYGRSSEQLDRELTQMQLSIEDLEASLAAKPPRCDPRRRSNPRSPSVGRYLKSCREKRSCTRTRAAAPPAVGSCASSARMSPRCSSTCRGASR